MCEHKKSLPYIYAGMRFLSSPSQLILFVFISYYFTSVSSYGTKCVTDMFAPINRNWTTTPYTEIPGLYLAGSDAFLPSVTGAMYGGCLCAAAVLGKVGSIRLGLAILSHLAKRLRDENPKLSRVEAFVLAVKKFME